MLKRIILALVLLAAAVVPVDSQVAVPNTLVAGTTITASGLNTNFTTIANHSLDRLSGGIVSGNIAVDPGITIDGVDIGVQSCVACTPTFAKVTTTNTSATSATFGGGITAGTGTVGIVDTTGKIPAISSTFFTSLSGANLTALPAGQLTGTAAAINGSAITSLNASALASGTAPPAQLGSGSPGVTTFLRGDGAWAKSWSSVSVATTGTVDNWAPGLVGNTIVYLNNTSLLTIDGMANGFDGQLVQFVAINTGQVDFAHASGASSAGNRLNNIVASAPTSLAPSGGGMALYQYQSSLARWQLLEHEQGGWITPTFSAANYSTNAAATWTVTGGEEISRAYYLKGKTLTVASVLLGTSVSSSTATCLREVIPGGFNAIGSVYGVNTAFNNSVWLLGTMRAQASAPTFLEFCYVDQTSMWQTSVLSTNIYASLSFSVS